MGSGSRSHRLLIVDDQPLVLTAIARFLEQKGYEVHTASHGEEGMAVAARVTPDLVITDIRMPVMDGWAMVRALRATPAYTLTPVIILTDEDTSESRMEGFRIGADDFVGKGTIVEELEVRIARALERSVAIRQMLGSPPAAAPSAPPSAGPPRGGGEFFPRRTAEAPRPAESEAVSLGLPPLAEEVSRGKIPPSKKPSVPAAAAPAAEAESGASTGEAGMRGTVDQIGLASILTLLSSGQKTGILSLTDTDPERTGRIFMRQGKVLKIHVEGVGDKDPFRAFTQMMKWRRASFAFSIQDVTAHDEVHTSVDHLLMEASRILDEGLS